MEGARPCAPAHVGRTTCLQPALPQLGVWQSDMREYQAQQITVGFRCKVPLYMVISVMNCIFTS